LLGSSHVQGRADSGAVMDLEDMRSQPAPVGMIALLEKDVGGNLTTPLPITCDIYLLSRADRRSR